MHFETTHNTDQPLACALLNNNDCPGACGAPPLLSQSVCLHPLSSLYGGGTLCGLQVPLALGVWCGVHLGTCLVVSLMHAHHMQELSSSITFHHIPVKSSCITLTHALIHTQRQIKNKREPYKHFPGCEEE